MARYTRVARQEFPSTDPGRTGKMDVAYVYMDERFQTITVRLPLEEDTETRVAELLRERVTHAEGAGPPEIDI